MGDLFSDAIDWGTGQFNSGPGAAMDAQLHDSLGTPAGTVHLPGVTDLTNANLRAANAPGALDTSFWNSMAQRGVKAGGPANPYEQGPAVAAMMSAREGREDQTAALRQLMSNINGPGIADMQAQLQRNQMFNAAAPAAAGRGGFLAAMNAGGQLAGQQGMTRGGEQFGSINAAGQGANGLRGQDLGASKQFMNAGYQARGIGDQNTLAMQQLGQQAELARLRDALERQKLYERARQLARSSWDQGINRTIGLAAPVIGGAINTPGK